MTKEQRSEIQYISRKYEIENSGPLPRMRDMREEILSLKVSPNTRIRQCNINGFSYHSNICITIR
jgi:hypothetical protein